MKCSDYNGLINEYRQKLLHEGIPTDNFKIVLKLESAAFVIANGNDDAILVRSEDLKSIDPLVSKVFASRKDVAALMFCHSKYCMKAIGNRAHIPPVLDDMAQIVGVNAKLFNRLQIDEIARSLKKSNACLILGDSPDAPSSLAVGRTAEHAFAATIILEKTAQAYIEGAYLGGAKKLTYPLAWLFHQVYNYSYAKMDEEVRSQTEADFSRTISASELAIRKEIVMCGIKMSEENLVQGTWGNISVRLDDKYMLVTPSGLAYNRISPYDIVRVDMRTLAYEGGLKPTSEKGIHAALLLQHPNFNCIIHTHSVNCSVFAAARRSLPVKDLQTTALIGKETGYAKTKLPGSKALVKAVANAITDSVSTCIMGNHGMLVCGASSDSALDKCRVMEKAARSYLDSVSNC